MSTDPNTLIEDADIECNLHPQDDGTFNVVLLVRRIPTEPQAAEVAALLATLIEPYLSPNGDDHAQKPRLN